MLAQAAYQVASHQPDQRPALTDEALATAQRAGQTSASAALAQMAARFGSGDTALAKAVREQQDLVQQWRGLDKALIAALGKPSEQRDASAEDTLRGQRSKIEARISALSETFETEFPDYAALTNPKPLSVAEMQELLGPDEALAVFLVRGKASFVWAVTREGLDWKRIDLRPKALSAQIAALRKGLDLDAVAERKADPVDLKALHSLYQKILAPVEDTISGKKHLLVVPSGALTSLPFHLLVTAPPLRRLCQSRMAGAASCHHHAAFGCKPEGIACPGQGRRGAQAPDRLWRSHLRRQCSGGKARSQRTKRARLCALFPRRACGP